MGICLLKAFILAAGKSKRLSSLTSSVPKPMLEIAGKPILEHNILMCKKAGVNEIFINLHYLADKITDYFGDGSIYDLKITYKIQNLMLKRRKSMRSLIRESDVEITQ